MLPKYISGWLRVIESMQNENTYKLAWGRALVECIFYNKYKEDKDLAKVSLDDISMCMLKYYWNQTFFFNLKQSPKRADGRQPRIVSITNQLIEKYKKKAKSSIPIWFDKVVEELSEKELNKAIKEISRVLPNDVSWRFKRIDKEEIDLYEYDHVNRVKEVTFKIENIELVKEYALIISKLLNYKWAQLLEQFNYAPKIVNKVNSISQAKLKRKSLVEYKNQLLKQFKDGKAIDFYTGKQLDPKDISVDHVIPWSFMYSDDIWNLVLTSKRNNSTKSNGIPTEEIINKLKERNSELIGVLDDKYDLALKESISNSYVDKYYFECRM